MRAFVGLWVWGALSQGGGGVRGVSSARIARGRAGGGGGQVVMLMVRRLLRMVVKVVAQGQRLGGAGSAVSHQTP